MGEIKNDPNHQPVIHITINPSAKLLLESPRERADSRGAAAPGAESGDVCLARQARADRSKEYRGVFKQLKCDPDMGKCLESAEMMMFGRDWE